MLTRTPLVLVVEDSEISRTVARALLAAHDVCSDVASDGLEAVRMVGERAYAAVLMDCHLLALDGYETAARIRAAQREEHLPIIAMSACLLPGDRERALAAGMDDFLSKPLQTDELAAVIARWTHANGPVARAGAAASPEWRPA